MDLSVEGKTERISLALLRSLTAESGRNSRYRVTARLMR